MVGNQSMGEDRDVLKEVWDASIPILFTLAAEEVVSLQRPDPYYLMVARITYFPLVMDKVIKYFSKFISSPDHQSLSNVWLDFNGQPLKWHYPVGLLWDMFGDDHERREEEKQSSSCNLRLPWTITIHFQDFPEDELIRCSSRSAFESLFMSAIKEADTLKHRGDVMANLQKKDHNMLWTGLLNNKFDQFWSVNRKLMSFESGGEKTAGEGLSSPVTEASSSFRFIPIRVYLPDKNPQTYIQKLVKPVNESVPVTLFDFLSQHNFFYSSPSSPASAPEKHDKPDGRREETASSRSELLFPPHIQVLIHGMEVPPETPLQWMSQHLSYPDNFIHLCILPSNNKKGPHTT